MNFGISVSNNNCEIDINDNEFAKLKNLTFNPFSRNSNGKTFNTQFRFGP